MVQMGRRKFAFEINWPLTRDCGNPMTSKTNRVGFPQSATTVVNCGNPMTQKMVYCGNQWLHKW